MRPWITGVLALVLTYGAAAPAFGGAIHITFNENGTGTWSDTTNATQNGYSGQSGSLNGARFPDAYCVSNPGSCVGGNTLIYALPELVVSGPVDVGHAGDIIGSADPNPSDVLFFTNSFGVNDGGVDANLMVFYSTAGGGLLADTGLPHNAGTFIDKANEGADGSFVWLPNGQVWPDGNQYNGFSPEAPEPASLFMVLLGAGALGLGAWRRTR